MSIIITYLSKLKVNTKSSFSASLGYTPTQMFIVIVSQTCYVMVRRGSKDHANDIDINKKSIKSRKQKSTKSKQVQMQEPTSDSSIAETEEELKDDSPKRRTTKRRDKKAIFSFDAY